MKNRYLLCLLALGAFSFATAQDLEIKEIFPEDLGTLRKTEASGLNTITLTFEATEDISRKSEFEMYYAWGDDKFDDLGETESFDKSIDEGDEFSRTFGIEVEGDVGDTLDLTLLMYLEDDTIPDNDTFRIRYVVSETQAQRDLTTTISSPAQNTIWNVGNSYQLTVEVTNTGVDDFEDGEQFVYILVINDQAQGGGTVGTYEGADLKTGESTSLNLNIPLPTTFPLGSFNFCVLLYWADVDEEDGTTTATRKENYIGDNLGCVFLLIEKNSIDERFASVNTLFYQQGQIVLEMANNSKVDAYNVTVLDLTGREVANKQIQTSYDATQKHAIDAAGLKPGVYLVSFITNEGKFVGSEKLLVR